MARQDFTIGAAMLSACVLAALIPDTAQAFPVLSRDQSIASGASPGIEQVQSRIGYWRKRQEQADRKRYRGNPGAQRILRQQRRNLCRNTPEMC